MNIEVADLIFVSDRGSMTAQPIADGAVFVAGGTGSSGEDFQAVAQSFTATGTNLKSVVIFAADFGVSDNLRIDITSSIGGSSLGNSTVTGVGLAGAAEFIFSSAISLTPTSTYYIQITRTGAIDGSVYLIGAITPSVYAGGQYYQRDNNVWTADATIDLFFAVKYQETPKLLLNSNINKSEAITVTESVNRLLTSNRSVSDSITVTESKNVALVHNVKVSDSVIATDSKTNIFPNPSFESNTNDWGMDANYTRSNEDSFSGSWSVKQVSTADFQNFTTENDGDSALPLVAGKTYTLSFYYKMAINSGGGVNIELKDDSPYSGNTLATDSISGNAATWTRKSITFTASSAGKVYFRLYNNNSDLTAFYDAFQLELGSTATPYFEGTATTLNVQTETPTLIISKSENITITESVNLLLSLAGIAVNDSVSVSEMKAIFATADGDVFDQIMVTEAVQLLITSMFFAVSDEITVTEQAIVVPQISPSVSDSISTTEQVNLLIPALYIQKQETISVTDSMHTDLNSFITVNDSINLTEATDSLLISDINVSDQINITENVTGIVPIAVNASELVSVLDQPTLVIPTLLIVRAEAVNVSESINVSPPVVDLKISTSDAITLTENTPIPEFVELVVVAQKIVMVDGQPAILLFDAGSGLPIYTYI